LEAFSPYLPDQKEILRRKSKRSRDARIADLKAQGQEQLIGENSRS